MLKLISENRAPVLAVILLLSFLLLLSARIRTDTAARQVESVFLTVLSPVTATANGVVSGSVNLWNNYVDLRGATRENLELRRELAALQVERQRLGDAARENWRLKEVLGMRQALTLETVAARVVLLELSDPSRTALLDRGSRSGIRVNDPVITPHGVVGRVTDVAPMASKVHLLIDPYGAAAGLMERTRVQGLAVGRAVNELEMQYVPEMADVQAGDAVDTSGLDGIYPKGFRLGLVREVTPGVQLQQRVVLGTAVDFRTLEEVLVIVNHEQADSTVEAGGG